MSYVPWRAFLDAMEFLRGMLAAQEAYVHLEVFSLCALFLGVWQVQVHGRRYEIKGK